MKEAKYSRKALLVISDGGDNYSRYTAREVKSLVREGDVMIYAVGIFDRSVTTEEELRGPELLSEVAQESGGRAFTIDNSNDMDLVVRRVGLELRNQYVLGYVSSNKVPGTEPMFRDIQVRLARAGFEAFHRRGYYQYP